MRPIYKTLTAACVSILLVSLASRAYAPGGPSVSMEKLKPGAWSNPTPVAQDLVGWQQGDELQWVTRADFGIVDSQDPHTYLCFEAYLENGAPRLVATDTDRWILTSKGSPRDGEPHLLLGVEDGCKVETVRELHTEPEAHAVAPASDHIAVLTARSDEHDQRLLVSDDSGATFETRDLSHPKLDYTGIAFAEPGVLMVSAVPPSDGGATEPSDKGKSGELRAGARFFRTDGPSKTTRLPDRRHARVLAASGDTFIWWRRTIESDGSEVGPLNQDLSLVWGTLSDPTQTHTGTRFFQHDIAMGPNGHHVWATGRGRDREQLMYLDADGDDAPTWSSFQMPYGIPSLAAAGDTLVLGAYGDASFHLGQRSIELDSTDSPPNLQPVTDFDDLKGPSLDCLDESVQNECRSNWSQLKDHLDTESASED